MALFVDDCPRCGAQEITFDVLSAIPAGSGHVEWLKRFEVFVRCRRCRKSTTFLLEIHRYEMSGSFDEPKAFLQDISLNSAFRSLGFVGLKDTTQVSAPEHVPDEIKAAFEEGATCMAVRCWNAASTMFRLSLDLATRPLLPAADSSEENRPNARERRDLGLRIPWLIQNGRLPADLATLAAAVREDGNDGAHSGNLTEADAEDLMDFSVVLLERLYTEQGRLTAAAARRADRRRPREQ